MKNAFTIIELLIVTAIIGIGISGGIAAYGMLGQAKQLDYESQKIADFIALYQKKSQTPPACSTGSEFQGYQLNFSAINNDYDAYICCGASQTALPTSCTTAVESINISSSNVAIQSTGYVIFKPVGAGSTINPNGYTLTIKNTASSQCVSITFGLNGLFTIQDSVSC